MRIYSELKWLFSDAKHRYKVKGTEFDIFIPSIRLAIEYDGAYWHTNKRAGEVMKNWRAQDSGINLVHIREAPLERLSETDLMIKKPRKFCKETMNKIVAHVFHNVVNIDLNGRLSQYLTADSFQNESLYLKEVRKYYQDHSHEGVSWIQSQFDFSQI